MASPTTRGKYKKQALGEGLNTWGLASGLNGLFDVMDEALHGVNEITLTGTTYTLTSTNYTTNDIRFRQFKFTGNYAATITIPATQNWWIIENQTGQTLTFDNGSNTATLQTGFFGLVVTNGTTVTSLTLPDGVSAKTVADNILSVNQVATDSASVIAVAGKTTEIARLGTADAVADMAILGTVDVVNDLNVLGTSANVTAMGHLGTSANVTAMGHLGTAANVTAMGELGTSANVTAMGNLGTSTNVTNMANLSPQTVRDDMAALGTSAVRADMAALADTTVLADMAALGDAAVVADMNLLGDAAVIADMDLLGTTAMVTAMGHLGTSANVTAMGHLGTAANVTNMSNLGTSANVTNMNTLADIQDGTVATNAITTVASNVTDVTNYSSTYLGPKNSAPTQRNDGSALQAGDLVFRTDLDQMQVRNAANNAWSAVAVTASNFLTVSNNLSDVADAATARTNLGGVITEISQDTTPQLGGDLDMQSHSISSGVLGIKNTGSQSELRLYCEVGNAHYTALKASPHGSYAGNVTLTLPANDGDADQFLKTDGNGVTSWADAGGGGNQVQLTANGSIADGKPVILENAGTVAQVGQTGSAPAAVLQGASGRWMPNGANVFGWSQMFYNTVDDTIVVVYRDEQNSNYATVCIGTVSNTTSSGVSWGTPATLSTAGGAYWLAGMADGNGRMAAFWQDGASGNIGKCRGFVKSGSSVSLGNTISTYDSAGVQYNHAVYDSYIGAIVLGYRQYTNSNKPYLLYCQVNSSNNINIIAGPTEINGQDTEYNRIAYSPDHQRVMMVFCNSSNHLKYSLMSYSGGSLYNGSNGTIDANSNQGCCVVYDESIDKFITFYGSNTNTRGEGRILTVTAGGTASAPNDSVSTGTAYNFNSYATGQVEVAYWAGQNMSVIAYTGPAGSYYAKAQTVSVSGSTITYGGELDVSGNVYNNSTSWHMPVYDPDNDLVVIGFKAYNGFTAYQSLTTIIALFAASNLTTTNFLGIASGSVTNGQTATIQLTGNVDDAQTGMTVNDTMYVQDNGTLANSAGSVSVVAGRALSATQLKIA